VKTVTAHMSSSPHGTPFPSPFLDQDYSKTSNVPFKTIYLLCMPLTEAFPKTAVFTQSPSKLTVLLGSMILLSD